MTKTGKLLLGILSASKQPLNASQVHEKCGFGPDLATVYRNLQALEREGLTESFVFDCHARGIERYYTAGDLPHTHYLHCEECHTFIPIDSCPFDAILSDIAMEKNFRIDQHFFTITGICAQCGGS